MHTPEGLARQKKQEQRIATALTASGFDFKREHTIDFMCLGDATGRCARVDFLLLLSGRVIMLEVDEDQHRFGYGPVLCDMARMADIVLSLAAEGNTLPIQFVRYNPHAFKVDGATVRTLKRDREACLVSYLRALPPVDASTPPLAVQYMFYDTEAGHPVVTRDPDYSPHFADCCLPPITA